MPWIAVELTLDASAAGAVADALLEAGAISVDWTDARAGTDLERPIFNEPAADATPAWDVNRLLALFPERSDIVAALEQARSKAQLSSLPPHRTLLVAEQDWVRLTQRQFEPIRISQRLWIVPSWHTAPDPHAINIVLDPGVAFGTGSHATTRLCLEWLDQNLRPGTSVIDYGCGSGILAIAAAKLGADHVTGVDIDPQALAASRYNARSNGVAVTWVTAETRLTRVADIVIANIQSRPLKVLAPLLAGLTRPEGSVVLSGIIAVQADDVANAYRAWFYMRSCTACDGWVRLEGVRYTR